jgi:SMC interacting uncharacterized protein involved in chromosome segregation
MILGVAPTIANIPNKTNASPKTKKNVATVALAGLAAAGAISISEKTFGKSFAWNTKINKVFKDFAKSSKEFIGAEPLKKFAGKIAKTTARQKLLGALAVGTLATIMAVREHFSKKEGAEAQKKIDSAKVGDLKKAYNKKLSEKDNQIDKLESDIMLKDADISALNSTIEAVDKAADKLGVGEAIAKEITK